MEKDKIYNKLKKNSINSYLKFKLNLQKIIFTKLQKPIVKYYIYTIKNNYEFINK